MDSVWQNTLRNHADTLKAVENDTALNERITESAAIISEALKKGNKVVIFGNGGSAADAQHIAAEFVGRFRRERNAMNVFALTGNTDVLTSVANDYDYDAVFERQVETFVNEGDIAVGITTSGKSGNVLRALEKAKEKGAFTIAMTGESPELNFVHLIIDIPSPVTSHVQEMHMMIGHYWADYTEQNM